MQANHRFGRTAVEVVVGDLVRTKSEALVCPANTAMALGGRPDRSVAGALVEATEGRAQRAVKEAAPAPVALGAVVETDGCGLDCSRIFYVAGHEVAWDQAGAVKATRATGQTQEDLPIVAAVVRGLETILGRCKELGLKSLALPLVGAGTIGLPPAHVAQLVVGVVRKRCEPGHSLRRVTIVAKVPEVALAVEEALHAERVDTRSRDLFKEWVHALESMKSVVAAKQTEREPSVGSTARMSWSYGLIGRLYTPGPAPVGDSGDGTGEGRGAQVEGAQAADRVRELEAKLQALESENEALRRRVQEGRSDRQAWPMPIAFAQSMVDLYEAPSTKKDNLQKAIAILAKYLATITLASYEATGATSVETNRTLRACLIQREGDGRWRESLKIVAKALRALEAGVVQELPDIILTSSGDYAPLLGKLARLIDLRNKQVHSGGIASEQSAEEWLAEALPIWRGALEAAGPLLAYRLVSVEALHDFADSDEYLYRVHWLEGDGGLPRPETVAWRSRLKRGCVYLKHPSDERFLKMSPFLGYSLFKETQSWETAVLDPGPTEFSFATFRFDSRFAANVTPPRCLAP